MGRDDHGGTIKKFWCRGWLVGSSRSTSNQLDGSFSAEEAFCYEFSAEAGRQCFLFKKLRPFRMCSAKTYFYTPSGLPGFADVAWAVWITALTMTRLKIIALFFKIYGACQHADGFKK